MPHNKVTPQIPYVSRLNHLPIPDNSVAAASGGAARGAGDPGDVGHGVVRRVRQAAAGAAQRMVRY